jgi:hypothetical protein
MIHELQWEEWKKWEEWGIEGKIPLIDNAIEALPT